VGTMFDGEGSYPKVISAIYIPLDHVPVVLWEIRLEAVFFPDLGPLLITEFFMLLVMTMVRIQLGDSCEQNCSFQGSRHRIKLTMFANFPILCLVKN
jgi:hypothetical protein